MANGYFVVQNGLQVGPLTIDAASGTIQTSGNVNITGNLGVSSISKNDSSIVINDTGTGSNITFGVDGVVEHLMTGTLTTLNTALVASGNVVASATTASTSTTTGALVVKGGAGIAGDVKVGTSITVDGGAYGNVTTTQYASLFAYAYGPNNYSIIQAWSQGTQGLGINAFGTEMYSSGAINFRTGATVRDKDFPTGGVIGGTIIAANGAIINTTGISSTTTGTGALIISGGAGVSGALNAGSISTPTAALTTLAATNFSTANAQITGGTLTGLTNLTATTTQATNFSTANAQVTGGTVTGLTNLTATTTQATNFSTANAQITGTGSYLGTGASLVNSVYGTTGYFTNFSSANIAGVTNAAATTLVATNFSTGNIVATGGSINNVTVGATTHNTGRFTTLTATNVNAGTIGNTGATLTGTISTTTQNSITTMAGLVSLGSNNVDTVAQGNFTVTGNLTVQGVNQAIGSQNLTVADSIIELHTFANLAPLTFDDGRDIGLRFHYYKGADKNAVLIWENTTEQLHFYANALEVSSNISGTLGTVGVGELFAGNSTVSNSTGTGALRVTGGAGIGGAVYIGGTLNVSGVSNLGTVNTVTSEADNFSSANVRVTGGYLTGLANVGATTGTFTNVGGTLTTASQPNITTLGGVTSVGASGTTTITGILQTAAQTNVTSLGTLTGLTVSGAIVPNANLTINVGSASAWFNTFFGVSTQAKYADLAENYQADKAYTPGTVLMFGGIHEVTVADADSTAVAGVVSTNPAHLMNGQLSGPTVVALALQGRVPCNVIGPIKKGDMLVSAGFGYARSSATPVIGQVIGKALADYPSVSKGQIEVVVGRV